MSELEEKVEAWRRERYARLRAEVGWLTLAGLGWLREGENRVGADPSNDVVLPAGPAEAGVVIVGGGAAAATGRFTIDGKPVHDLPLADDESDRPTLLELGALRLCLIDRGGRLALRTWDTASALRQAFDGIDHWPVDPRWTFDAQLEPTPGIAVRVPDVLGTIEEQESPGTLAFSVGGQPLRLQALEGGPNGELFIVFGDATNGIETYGGGRFLYTDPPDANGTVSLDFNRAYNPPCVFSPYATCPLPWPANRLPIRVEAGERAYHPPRG